MSTEQLWMMLAFFGSGVLVTILSVVVGAYLMFKGKTAVPGERFFGGPPKGQVFTIPEAEETEEFPDAEKKVLERTMQFMSKLGGKT